MLEKLAIALGVSAFQLLIPVNETVLNNDSTHISVLLKNLRQNIQYDINVRFDRLKNNP